MIKSLVVFIVLGVVFAFLFYAFTFVEKIFKNKIFTFVLDTLLMIIYALSFFCFLIGYCNAQFRFYYLVMLALGFDIYIFTFHKLFQKPAKRLNRKLNKKLLN